jgi:tRNA dimethylallyltransferase
MATSDNRRLKSPLRILTGQTASGKSAVAVSLAREVGAELISLDSMKVYRGLDIGTAKPSTEVLDAIRFHMIDVVDAAKSYSLAQYLRGAQAAVEEIESRGAQALFVGGTPLYLRGLLYGVFEGPSADWALRAELMRRAREEGAAVLHEELRGIDPVTAERLHPNDLVRIVRAIEVARVTGRPISEHQRQYPAPRPAAVYRMAAIRRADDDERERINRRVDRMFERGLVEEVRALRERGELSPSAQKAIGYRETLMLLDGELSLAEAVEATKRSTWRMARKQRAWLKSFPDVHWLDVPPDEPPERTAQRVREFLFPPERVN